MRNYYKLSSPRRFERLFYQLRFFFQVEKNMKVIDKIKAAYSENKTIFSLEFYVPKNEDV